MAVILDRNQCSACGSCVDVCPSEALVLDGDTLNVIEENCVDCGECVGACPSEALSMP